MEKSFKLRSAIEKEMANQGYNFSTLSEKSGINRGVFSAILNSTPPKPVSFHQLATITEALNMPAGWLFDEYVGECFYGDKPNRRRIEPFLLACSELGRTDLVRQVLKRLLEDLKYLPFVFETAETLFLEGKLAQSAPFYEIVAEHEKHQHSVRLSVSQYRLFRTRLSEDGEENLKAAVQFEPFRHLLPGRLKLDALLRLSNLYYELGKYADMEVMAGELFDAASELYEGIRSGRTVLEAPDEPKALPAKSLVFYYASALLHKQLALIEQERFEEAKPYGERYGDLSGFEVMDDDGRQEVERFKVFALGNGLDLELMLGNFSILPQYADYMDRYPAETLLCLVNLVKAANRHGADIDDILSERYIPIDEYFERVPENYYPEAIIRSTFASLHYHLAVYHHRHGRRTESAEHVRTCWQLSQELNNQQHFRQLASLLSLPPLFVQSQASGTGEAERS
ncbi:helix-turn-helix domain-containing protein [Saccharibacillus alkalitolerans]|uniref:Helix-turn-helix transcriptional regulator n=1 Tax=Saccharibacillus alkalitolerans TaxID=2705290 RepID=A0ABX0F9R3_9BACL|nr:helix-turn-helix transcriptional regulator [Saccharibacillus alkalitolerans]NGZ76214.1 helix-turn-helix transcriptional regulator [Saccharibacillus alkalitolerans]